MNEIWQIWSYHLLLCLDFLCLISPQIGSSIFLETFLLLIPRVSGLMIFLSFSFLTRSSFFVTMIILQDLILHFLHPFSENVTKTLKFSKILVNQKIIFRSPTVLSFAVKYLTSLLRLNSVFAASIFIASNFCSHSIRAWRNVLHHKGRLPHQSSFAVLPRFFQWQHKNDVNSFFLIFSAWMPFLNQH